MEGSIQKRKGKRGVSWRIVIDMGYDPVTGKRRQKVETVRGTKAEAERRKRELLSALDNGIYAEAGKMKLAEYLNKWFSHHMDTLSASTARRYEGIIKYHLIPSLGQVLLKKLSTLQVQEFVDKELKEGRKDNKKTVGVGLSAASVSYEYRVLHMALGQAVQWKLIHSNPANGVKIQQNKQQKIPAILSEKEVAILLEAIKDSYLFIPTFLAVHTGMRLGEILGISWNDVDLERQSIEVNRTSCQVKAGKPVFKEPKTVNSRRVIDISQTVVDVLKEHKVNQAKQRLAAGPAWQEYNLVCCLQDGRPINPPSLSSHFRQTTAKLGLPIKFHGLRHTHASLLLKAGIPAKVVSERLGHSSITVTMDVYSHVMPGMQKEAANKLEVLIKQHT